MPATHCFTRKRKELTLEALVHSLQRLADRCPVLFIVEDADWIDPTTLDLMTRIISRIRQMRVLLLIWPIAARLPTQWWCGISSCGSSLTLAATPSAERRNRGGDDRRKALPVRGATLKGRRQMASMETESIDGKYTSIRAAD